MVGGRMRETYKANGDPFFALITTALTTLFFIGMAAAQSPTPGYFMIYGNNDGSPMTARLGQRIDIPLWGATPPGSTDSVVFMHNPLSSNDAVISSRLGGYFPDTLVGFWDERSFLTPTPDTLAGWTNQSMLGFAYLYEPRDPQNFFWTNGDTVLICIFSMRVSSDTSLIGDTLYTFNSGLDPDHGTVIWEVQNGLITKIPALTFSPLVITGMACDYVQGDINGNGVFNGIDIVYGVNYFKGGPPPPIDCHPSCPNQPDPFYAAGDVNGDCVFNGLDLGYGIRWCKEIHPPLLRFCPECPPDSIYGQFYLSGMRQE
jgi:hypothetical protein